MVPLLPFSTKLPLIGLMVTNSAEP